MGTALLAGCGAEQQAKDVSVHDGMLYPLEIRHSSRPGEVSFFQVEVANEPEEWRQGLMHRTHMDANKGMLFIWDSSDHKAMWMKNTHIPLDMLFIQNETVLDIVLGAVPFSEETVGGHVRVDKVLELNAGTVEEYGIQVGDKVVLTQTP